MRAIDADALIELLKREEEYLDGKGARERADGITDAIMDVIDAPPPSGQKSSDAESASIEIKKTCATYGNNTLATMTFIAAVRRGEKNGKTN